MTPPPPVLLRLLLDLLLRAKKEKELQAKSLAHLKLIIIQRSAECSTAAVFIILLAAVNEL